MARIESSSLPNGLPLYSVELPTRSTTVLVAFDGVVEHDVEYHFEACFVQRANHRLEFRDGIRNGVAWIGRVPRQ
jgi:hypothetical protein